MVQILITIAMIVAIVIPILKKYDAITVMFTVSIIALIGYTIFTDGVGGSTGNKFTDIIEYMVSSTQSSFSGNVLNGLLIIAYIGFMDFLKATDILAIAAASLLKGVKQKYLLVVLVFILSAVLKIALNGALPVVTLLVAVLYPVMLRLGCTRASVASALILGSAVTWGPAEQGVIIICNLLPEEDAISFSDFFIKYQFANKLVVVLVMGIVLFFTSQYFDKKDHAEGGDPSKYEEKKLSDIPIPKFFGVLPLLPLIFAIIANGTILPITLSFPGSVILSVLISVVCTLIFGEKKTFKQRFNDVTEYYNSAGNVMKRSGFLIVAGAIFSATLQMVGGMDLIIENLQKLGGGHVLLSFALVILGLVVTACTVSYRTNLNIFVPFAVSIAKVTGFNIYRLAELANMACGLGTGFTPASNVMLFISGVCEVEFPTILKRNIPSIIAGALAGTIFTLIVG